MDNFQVLSAIKSHIQEKIEGQRVYLSPEPTMEPPYCYLEIEEVLNAPALSSQSMKGKVRFKTSCFHDEVGVREALAQGQRINKVLDGVVIPLRDKQYAIVKLMGNVVELSDNKAEKTVTHFYESIIREL